MALGIWRRRLLAALVGVLAFGLVVAVVLAGPGVLLTRRLLAAHLSEALGWPVAIAALEVRPRRAEIVLVGIDLAGGDGAPVGSIARLVVGVDVPASLRARSLVARTLLVEAPRLRLVRFAPGRTNLTAPASAPSRRARGHPAPALERLGALVLGAELRVRDARLDLEDRVTGWRRTLTRARWELPRAAARAPRRLALALPRVQPPPPVLDLASDVARALAPDLVPPAGSLRAATLAIDGRLTLTVDERGRPSASVEGTAVATGVRAGGWDFDRCMLQAWGVAVDPGRRLTAGFSCAPRAGGSASGVLEGTLRPLRLDGTVRARDVDLGASPPLAPRAAASLVGRISARARLAVSGTLARPVASLLDADLTVQGFGARARRDGRWLARFPLLTARGARLDQDGGRLVIDEVSARGGWLRLSRTSDGRVDARWLDVLPISVLVEELILDATEVDLRSSRSARAAPAAVRVSGARVRGAGLSADEDVEGVVALSGTARLPDGTARAVEGSTAVRAAARVGPPPAVSRR